MNIVRWEPIRELDEFFNRYSRLANRNVAGSEAAEWTPTADISETAKEYVIKAELPAVKREDVKVSLENGVITISGERKQEKKEHGTNEIRVESLYGTFSRSFSLPDNIDAKAVSAESKDGVLFVHIPKTDATKPEAITVSVQ